MLAHSKNTDGMVQTYSNHIENVSNHSEHLLSSMLRYYNGVHQSLLKRVLKNATTFHDFGKLDQHCQDVLQGVRTGRMINHCEAGTQLFGYIYQKTGIQSYRQITHLISGHHIGMKDMTNDNPSYMFDQSNIQEKYKLPYNESVQTYTQRRVPTYLKTHIKQGLNTIEKTDETGLSALDVRMLMSCLVNADHADTAKHFLSFVEKPTTTEFKPEFRIGLLDQYVNSLNNGSNSIRQQVRTMMYRDCQSFPSHHKTYLIDGYVGTGKTLAGLRAGLELARSGNHSRILFVAPLTKIIRQTAEVYRKAILTKDDGDKTWNVFEHHHKTEFGNFMGWGSAWEPNFICVTSVQFFETLAGNHPMMLKKLHNLAGSIIIIDEYHASLPLENWKVVLKWLKLLTENWGCKVIFSSGTPVDLWSFDQLKTELNPFQIVSENTKTMMKEQETIRVKQLKLESSITVDELMNNIEAETGSVLVVLNTIKNAAVTAYYAQKRFGNRVLHLSGAMTTEHQLKTYFEIERRIKAKEPIILVSTSMVETGFDVSFSVAFREMCSVASSLQIGGRVSRENEYINGRVFNFKFEKHSSLTFNPSNSNTIGILQRVFQEKGNLVPSDAQIAMKLELQGVGTRVQDLCDWDDAERYQTLTENFKIFDDEKISAIGSTDIVYDLQSNNPFRIIKKLQEKCFRVYRDKIYGDGSTRKKYKVFKLSEVLPENHPLKNKQDDLDDICVWDGYYSNFYGYMSQTLFEDGFDIDPGTHIGNGVRNFFQKMS